MTRRGSEALQFVNGGSADCGCRFSYVSGDGEYADVATVFLCSKHAQNQGIKWTNKKPTKSGYYWTTYGDDGVPFVHIVEVNENLQFNEPYQDEDDDGNLDTFSSWVDVKDTDCLWAGPISEPGGRS